MTNINNNIPIDTNNEINNLLEDNINLMEEIDNILDKNNNQINNIQNSYDKVNNDNQISTYYLNRMSNFFFRVYSSLTGKKNPINKKKVNVNVNNMPKCTTNDVNNNLINVMKQKSYQISDKIDKQNDQLSDINNLVEINNYRTKKNIKMTDRI